ncbi:MAG: tRNA (adenosine(37)-N6)-dimethylallyltransferase MiaA [Campylobacteraceae bacterium]|jgi:tRNA dimethylallyltransferase|nr:tRNA (adenosine(37)-N6)-dimethylallyltransferase MiaA [Campylobacteraceae bacterium]
MQFALIGTTACGKSDLAVEIARKSDGIILSLDSLCVYKEIDIASAKPSKEQLSSVKHYGIDVIAPNENFNVTLFFDLYFQAAADAESKNAPLIIVGGTSFYLKALLSGLSDKPLVSGENQKKVSRALRDLEFAYDNMSRTDPIYAEKVEKNDIYRMGKWYEIYYETGEIPSDFLRRTKKDPVINELKIFEIETSKEELRERIKARTKKMIEEGLVDEAARLEKKYTREPNCMKSIGIREVIEYFDGYGDITLMEEKIIDNTVKLAKRQRTFNRTQFLQPIIKKPLSQMDGEIMNFLHEQPKYCG